MSTRILMPLTLFPIRNITSSSSFRTIYFDLIISAECFNKYSKGHSIFSKGFSRLLLVHKSANPLPLSVQIYFPTLIPESLNFIFRFVKKINLKHFTKTSLTRSFSQFPQLFNVVKH